MSPYRLALRLEPPPAPKESRAPLVLVLSAVAHVALLVACAAVAPRDPEPPRTQRVRVLTGETTTSETGEPAFRATGYADAIVRER